MLHMTSTQGLTVLTAQHAELRDRIARCEDVVDGLEAGHVDVAALLREVSDLRRAFEAHNQLEEQLLRPVLLDADWLGEVRIARMVDDHVEEHRALRGELDTATAWELRRVLASLRAHLDAEEQHFLTRKTLRSEGGAGVSQPRAPRAKPARDPRSGRRGGRTG
jgi:hemerythrin-like domain-containing protein